MNAELQLSPHAASLLAHRLLATSLTPVAKAALRHERRLRRIFLRAIREARAAVPMRELEDALRVPGTGAALYVMGPVIEGLLEDTPMTGGAYFRKAESNDDKVVDILKGAMESGMHAGELCTPIVKPVPMELDVAKKLGLPEEYKGVDSRAALREYAVDNPLPRAKHTSFQDVQRMGSEVFQKAGTAKEFNIADLVSPQDYVQPTAVQYIMDGTYMKTRPLVATIDGEDVLINGNHNVLASKLKGQKSVEVTYLGVLR
jgi:hypothetical protein